MITVFGSINMDLIATTERLPKPGETVAGTGFSTAAGGKGANQALAATYLAMLHQMSATAEAARAQAETALALTMEYKAPYYRAWAAILMSYALAREQLDAAHLDAVRRVALFEEIHSLKAQAWMTGTDLSLFDGADCQIFEVRDGVRKPVLDEDPDTLGMELLSLEAGQMVMFHDELLHGGVVNRGTTCRVSLELTVLFPRDEGFARAARLLRRGQFATGVAATAPGTEG